MRGEDYEKIQNKRETSKKDSRKKTRQKEYAQKKKKRGRKEKKLGKQGSPYIMYVWHNHATFVYFERLILS